MVWVQSNGGCSHGVTRCNTYTDFTVGSSTDSRQGVLSNGGWKAHLDGEEERGLSPAHLQGHRGQRSTFTRGTEAAYTGHGDQECVRANSTGGLTGCADSEGACVGRTVRTLRRRARAWRAGVPRGRLQLSPQRERLQTCPAPPGARGFAACLTPTLPPGPTAAPGALRRARRRGVRVLERARPGATCWAPHRTAGAAQLAPKRRPRRQGLRATLGGRGPTERNTEVTGAVQAQSAALPSKDRGAHAHTHYTHTTHTHMSVPQAHSNVCKE